ncbi:MAG: YjbF family lipoprotein [Pseudorhodobacter sp.]|nr:YjbF family lipoprotein [Pseudorhodobacter sp.]
MASGNGSHDRVYHYLDGADQVQRFEYRCTMANTGNETITVVSLQHSTRHVTESCTGKTGAFVNEYWFDSNDFLRKSNQLLIDAWGSITLQRDHLAACY